LFFWKELERQVRITGIVEKVTADISNAYFNSRPEASRISAVASPQSQVINSREWLDEEVDNVLKNLQGKTIERPENWGGYLVKPICIEFWQGRTNRLHDRLQAQKSLHFLCVKLFLFRSCSCLFFLWIRRSGFTKRTLEYFTFFCFFIASAHDKYFFRLGTKIKGKV
jgi:hypothetical protein